MFIELTTQILFYYPTASVMDRIKMYSQYPARTSKDEGNKEEVFVTNDELALIMAECETAISRVFFGAVKLSKGITDSLLKNNALAIGSVNAGNVYGFRLNNYKGHNPNVLPIVDAAIQALWTNLIMTSWFAITKNDALYKVEATKTEYLTASYINSLTELYKPKINSVMPEYTSTTVEIDDETGLPVEDELISTPSDMQEIFYYTTFSAFPNDGVADLIYVDKSDATQYMWNGTKYVVFDNTDKVKIVSAINVDTVVINHDLNKREPEIKAIDASGEEWDIDYEPTDDNNGIASWSGLKTLTIYLS